MASSEVKAEQNNGLMVLITAQLGVAQADWGQEIWENYPGKSPSSGEAWLMRCSPYANTESSACNNATIFTDSADLKISF